MSAVRGSGRRPPRLGDYGVVGDGRTVALVSREGAVDWLCFPRFDSPSLFARLLDEERGGTFRVAPVAPARVERRYLGDTAVLQTRFTTAQGALTLTDFIPVGSEEEVRQAPEPESQLVRRLECTRGEVEVEVLYAPRPDYARRPARLRDAGPLGLRLQQRAALFTLHAPVPLHLEAPDTARARFVVRQGQVLHLSLTASFQHPAVLASQSGELEERLLRTLRWWRTWAGRTRYAGPHRDAVVRSAVTLKLLAFAPSGAIVAAPTTSLPERVGGGLNWDYRYCWLRDAALTTRALFGLGHAPEAHAFIDWCLHATRTTRPRLHVLYDVYGLVPRHEEELSHLSGHRSSRPVRLGNAAARQTQLDVYGEVIDSAAQLVRQGGALDRETQRLLCDLGEYVCHHWREPDSGIWEPRGPARHYTHSRVLCWTALERLLELRGRGVLPRKGPFERFADNRERIRQEVEARGFNPALGSYTQVLDGDTLDASLLLLDWYGYREARGPRMQGTFRQVQRRLTAAPGLLYRYEQSREAGEGAFGICGFWAAEFLARGGGSPEEAEACFARVLAYANDLGLFAEEMDPASGEPLGNFPQAFTHVGLITAALSLERRARAHPHVSREASP